MQFYSKSGAKKLHFFKDDLVFVTPIYYFGFSAQIKAAIDRFYSRNGRIQSKHLKSAFIATAWNSDNTVMSGLEKHIDILIDYLNLIIFSIMVFGLYTFIDTKLWQAMFLLTEFKFFDYNQSPILFYLGILAIVCFISLLTYFILNIKKIFKK